MANVKVAVRVRPLCKREEDAKAVIVVNEYQENVLGVANPKIGGAEGSSDHRDRIKHFSFDYCYFSLDKTAPNYASQQLIFNDLGSEVLDSSFDGYNVCLFAYGQTGSGKTYTMMGDETEQGVIPRLCESLLERVSSYEEDVTFKVEVSFLEIYNERVRDLLAPPNQAKYSLKVREHPKDGPYVQDLSHHLVSDYEQVLSLMHDGNLQRTTAATHMHELSSRSHAIFTITFIQAKMSHGMPSEIVSKINLVDLAGSERASINSSKDRLQEGANINKSLVTLGNCIQALGPHVELSKSLQETWFTTRQKRGEEMLESAADSALMAASMESLSMSEDWDALSGPRRRTNFVPYRNSILTWLLKDSLGGNSKTIMIATISPASIHYNETMSTLRYARRAKHIVNQPIVNEDRNVRLIRELRAEIDRLRMLLNSASLASSQASLIQDQNICRMLQENEQRVDQLTEAWVEKWSNAARIMQECNVGIRKESIGVIVESELPHLIGMDDDLLSTGIILYHLKEGRTKIGRENSEIHQDIVLYGPDVADEHAVIINIDGHVVLTPLRNSKCAVNGVNVHRPVELTQGAVILLGSTNMFRFNHPAEAVKLRERRASKIPGRGLRRALSAEFGKRISLSMSLDGSWSAEPESNLKKTPMRSSFSDLSSDISPIMMFNPGLELERRHKLEAEKLEDTRKQLAELEAKRAEAEAARQEQETMMLRSLQDHQDRIREQKELIERLKKEHQEAMALAQEELALLKGKINNQKEMGKQKLEGELTQLKEVPSYQSDLCTIPSVVSSVSSDLNDLSGLDVAKKRVALMELLQKQSQRKALAALERRQATLEVQERTAQLILKHEEQKLEDFETDPRLLEGEFSSEHSPEKELGERDTENTVDSSTENVSAELPTSGRVSPIGNSDPETIHNNNLHSPKKETKRIQKQNNKDMDQKKDQTNVAKKSSRKSDARPSRKVDLGPPKTKSREVKIKKESNGRSECSSRSLSPSITSRSSSPSKSSRSSSPSKSSRSSSPSKSSRSSSPSKSSRSSSPIKSFRSDSPTKSLRSDSPTKSSRSSSPADSTPRKSRQNSGNVFSRLYPQQDTKFDYLRKKSPPRYAEHEADRDRHRDSPHLIRRELSPLELDPIKLKDRRNEIQDNKHVRTSSVPSSNLPDRTKQNLHSRSRSASPGVNKPVKPVTRPKKSPTLQSSQETEKAGSRAKAKSKEPASALHGRSQREPVKDRDKNKRAQPATPNESDCSSPAKRKTTQPENTSKSKTSKGLIASPSRTRPVNGKAVDRNQSPKKKSEQTPSHRKTIKRPLSRSRSGKDGESTNSSSPRRKFARSPVVKPKNWPSMENLPKSTPKSEAFYVPLTSEQLRLELQKHASEQESPPHLEGGDLETSGCEQHWSPSRKRSVGKRPEQVQMDATLDRMRDGFDFNMDEVTNSNNGEDDGSSSESFIDSLEEDLRHDRRMEVELEHDDGPRVVDMTSADEDEFWAIPVSSEDILTASSDEGEDDDDDDIALNLDVHDRKQSSDTLESVNSNDELEADDPFHTTMVRVKTPEAALMEEKCSREKDAGSVLLGNAEIRLSHDSLDSKEFPLSPVLSDNEEARQCEDDICSVEHTDCKSVPLHIQTPEYATVGPNNAEKAEHDEKKDWPTEAQAEVCKRYGDNSIPETNLMNTDETSPKIDIHDRASHSTQGTDSNATQSVADLPFDHDISPEHSNLNVTFDLETVEPTEEEAEPCEKNRDDEVSERDHVENEKEGPQIVNKIMNDNVLQGPCFDEVYSKLDVPGEGLSSEQSHPGSSADKKIESLPTEVKVCKEDVPCEDPERNEQITTDQVLQNDSDNTDDTDELLLEELHSDRILLETDLPEEHVVSEPLNLDVTCDNEVIKPTDANVEACGKPEEDDVPEILPVKSEQSPEIDANDSKQNAPQEQQGRGFHSESDLSDEDLIKSFDNEFHKPVEGTENSEEGENEENPEEGALKMKMEDIEIKTDLPLESNVNENQSRTDLLEKDPISSELLHPDVTDKNETYGPTTEIEPGQNDKNKDGPQRLDIAEEDFGDASDLLSQELLSNGVPSITDLPPELRMSSDPLHSDVSCEEEKEGPINNVEMGKEAEPCKVPEMNQDRSPLSEELPINEIQSSSDIDVETPSLVSLQPDITCDKKTSLPTEEEIESCKNDGYDDVQSRSMPKTTGEDPHIDIKNGSSHLSEKQSQNEIHSMPDLPVDTNTSEPSHPDVICGQLTDGPLVDAQGTSFIGKPNNDRKNDDRIPNDEVVIVHHPKLQGLESDIHSRTQSPVELISRDLKSSPLFETERGTSINAEQKEPDEEVSNLINPENYTEDNSQDVVETELNSNAHGDRSNEPQSEGSCPEEYSRDNTVPIEKEPIPSCPAEDKGTCDAADQALSGLDRLDVSKCPSISEEDVLQNHASDDLEAGAKEDNGENELQDTVPVPILTDNNTPDKSIGKQCPQDIESIPVGGQVHGDVKDKEQVQGNVGDEDYSSEVTIPLISIQSDTDEIPTVSCTVMSNQLNQLQRPVMINLSTIDQDSSDSDEISSNPVSDDQSDFSEEEEEKESLLDGEHHPSEELLPPEERNTGFEPDLSENREQQIPGGHNNDTKDMVAEQDSVSSDAHPDDDKLKEHKNKKLLSEIPKMNGLPDQPVNQQLLSGANKPIGSNDGVQVMQRNNESIGDNQVKERSIPIRADNVIVTGSSDMNSDKPSSNQSELTMPCRKIYTNNHNFRFTRASPVPFSDEEMESMESPSSCSSTTAAEYRFDEEQTLSDFLEDGNEIEDEEAAMSDDVSAIQNSEVNGEITDYSQDNGTDNISGESETGLGIPEAVHKGILPYIQASLPPNVYKTIFNAESPLKQNLLTNSIADSTLPDESALYQSAMDTSLYQTAVESPSGFTNKNDIIPFKKTWKKDQILAYSTPTGTPEGTPVAKSSESQEQNKYGPNMNEQNGDSPIKNECRVPPQLSASPSSTMARKIPYLPEVTVKPHNMANTADASSKNENIPAIDSSICIGDINTDTKSGPNIYPEIQDSKEKNGEELRGLYHSPHDLPEQSYILHTLETIQEEDSMAEDSVSEDTCSTLHSNSPLNTRDTSPDLEHMLVAQDAGIPQNVSPTSVDNEDIATLLQVQEKFCTALPDEISQSTDQGVGNKIETNDAVGEGDNSDVSTDQSQTQNTNDTKCLDKDSSNVTVIKALKEDEISLPEYFMCNKQETSSSDVDDACKQIDDISKEKGAESETHYLNTSLLNKRTLDHSEDVSAIEIPTECEDTNGTQFPECSVRSQESAADDVQNTERKGDTVSDPNVQDTSDGLIKANPTGKRKDVFSRLYPKNDPKFEFKRKSAASTIPKGRSYGNVSPKIKRKDLRATKPDMSAAEPCEEDKNCDVEHPAREDDVADDLPQALSVLTDVCDKTSNAGNQKDDTSGTPDEIWNSNAAVSAGEDSVPEANLMSEPEVDDYLNDRTVEEKEVTNEMKAREIDEDTTNKIFTPSPDMYLDAPESEAVEKLKPFLGKDYAIASAKLTMFMRMFGLSVESTDSSEGSDSLKMHTDKGLVNRIVGEGVGYDPETFKYGAAFANSLSLSPESSGNKEDVTGVEYDGDQSWMGSDVAVDGDSSIRDLRSRSTTASDAELMSGGDDAMTESTSLLSLQNIDDYQMLETSLKCPTDSTRMRPETCITKSMQLANPGVDIAHTLNKLDVEGPNSNELSTEEDVTIKALSGSSSVGIGKQYTLDSELEELSQVDFDNETESIEACKERDHNHNMGSSPVLKSNDVDNAPTTLYTVDESMLPSPSSVANQQVPIQVQESVITSHEVLDVKHPDIYPVGKEPYEEENHDQEVFGSEAQETVPCLTPTVPEVIHASKVQLGDDMVSSIRKLKDIFVECEDNVNVDKENGPSFENYTDDGEKELLFGYVGGNKSPTNCTCESDNSTLLQNHVSERITVEKVQLAEMSLSTLLEKACISDDGDERSSSPEITLKEKDGSEAQGEQLIVLDDTVINNMQVLQVKINLKKDQGMNTDDALGVHVNRKGPAVKDVMSSGFDTDSLTKDKPSREVTAKEVSNASCGTSDDLGQIDSDTCKHDPDARLQVPFKLTALAKPIKVSVAYPSSDEPIKWHLLSTDSSSDSSQSSKDDVVMVTPAVDKATQCQAIDIVEDQANSDLDSSVFPGREYVHRSTSPRENVNSMHSFKPITPSPRHIIAADHMEPARDEQVNVDPVNNVANSVSTTREHKYPFSKSYKSAKMPLETELTSPKASLHKETHSDPPEATLSLQVPPIQAGNAVSPVYSPVLSARSTDDELAQIFATPKQSTPLKNTFTNTSPEVSATQSSVVDASTSTHDSLDDIPNGPESINRAACAQTSPFEIAVEPRSILDASTTTDDSLDRISSGPGSDTHETTHNACAQTQPSEKPAATACVQTSPFKELDNLKDCDVSHQGTGTCTETEPLTPHHIKRSAIDLAATDFSADEHENIAQQPTLCNKYLSENRSIGTSPIVELVFSNDAPPQAEHFSTLNIKTNTPNITTIDKQENQANVSSQSNNQECQTDLSLSGPASPASSADGASGPWRKASEVLEELSENMDSEELELFAVLMHKRRLSEQTVDRVKELAAKLHKSNKSDGLGLQDLDFLSQDELSQNTSNPANPEISSPQGQLEDTETHPDQNKTLHTLSPLPLSETGTGEFELEDIGRYDQPSRNEEENLQTVPPIDDDFLTLPGQKGSMSPPLVSALEQSHSITDSSSPRGEVTFDRKPTPPSNTRSERPTTRSPATYSKVPGSRGIGTSSLNDWHSLGITWDEPLNRNNNSSTDYSEDDITNGEITVDILNKDSLKQDSTGSKHSPKATLSTFSDVSFDSELDFPVDPNESLDQKDEMKSARNHASTQSLDSDLFLDGTEPELLALQADAEDHNANSGSLQFNIRDSNDLLENEDEGEGGDQGEVENQLNDAESFRMHMPPISPSKLDWLLAESETEPDVKYLPLSKHPEKDKIPLPGFKHQRPEGPFVINKQPNEELMKPFEENVYPQQTDVKAYPVKFAMDQEQKGDTVPSSSLANASSRSRHVTNINQIPLDNNQYPGVALPSTGNRYGTLERTGSSLGESSGIYSLASEVPNQHHVKTPAGSLESLLNAASTDEEKDLRQLQSEYEQLLRGRTSSGLHPVQTPDPNTIQPANRLKGSGEGSENSLPQSNGVLNGYSSGDSASSSEVEGFVHGHYSQSMDRRDISIELLEAQVMHGIGETDALLRFLDDDLPVEYWKARKNQTKSQPGKVEHGNPTTDKKKEITYNPSSSRNRSPVYQFRRSPSSSLKISPSGSQSGRSSPSSVTPPPPLQRVVSPLLRKSPSEKSPSPKGRFRPSEHLKFLRRVRENVIKATANPTSPTPPIQTPRDQPYTLRQVDEPVENIRTSSSFITEKNEMELFLDELREARKMSQSEIAKAEKELHPSRRRYSADEDSVFADAMPGTQHPGGGESRNHHPPTVAEKDGHQSRFQRSDEDIIDREIASMRAAASVIHPPSATSPTGTNPCKEEGDQSAEETEGSPSKPYYYEMYDLPSKIEPLSRNSSQNRPKSQFGYSLYKDPPRSDTALTKTYPPSRSSLRDDDPQRARKSLHQSGSIQLQQYTPLKSTGSSSSLPAPLPNRRPTPQPSGVYLSVPQHRGATRPHGGDSIQNFRGSPGSQVKISPPKSSLRNRRHHAGKAFQELPTVRESKLVWSRPECHLVAETALQTLVSEMAPFTTFDPRKSNQPEEERGWRYEGRERDILLLCKTHSATISPINSYVGIGIIKAPARTVFNYVKNPTNRQLYDPMLKEVKLKKDFGDDLQVVYMVFKTDQCLLQHPRDCLCVIKTLEMDDRFLVVASSIKHPRIPPKKKTIRADVLLAGCSIQPLLDGDMEHCRVTHLSQVNLNGDLQPKLINALSSSLPMCIADLRNIVQIGDV